MFYLQSNHISLIFFCSYFVFQLFRLACFQRSASPQKNGQHHQNQKEPGSHPLEFFFSLPLEICHTFGIMKGKIMISVASFLIAMSRSVKLTVTH